MRVLLVHDRAQGCSTLKQVLEQEPELSVVGELDEVQDLLTLVSKTKPDLLLLDWELPGVQIGNLLSTLHASSNSMKIVAFSEREQARQEALTAGADAFVSRQDPQEWLLTTLRTVGGLSYFSS